MLLAYEAAPTERYDSLFDRLVVESSVMADVLSTFSRILPKSKELITGFLPDLQKLSQEPSIPLQTKEFKQALKRVEGLNFLHYEDTLVSVPEGFTGRYVPFLDMMLETQPSLLKHCSTLLQEYETELSMFLSNGDHRLSQKSSDFQYKALAIHRTKYEKKLKPFFDEHRAGLTRQKLGTVFTRFADLNDAFILAEKLQAAVSRSSYDKLLQQVNTVSDLLDLIHQRIEDRSVGQVSGAMAKNIAQGAYEMGKLVELVSLYSYLSQTTLNAIKATAEGLERLFS